VKIVAYYRVSTKKQGESGLGLEGQQEAVRAFAGEKNATIIRHYTEIETGKSADGLISIGAPRLFSVQIRWQL
jgi:DNA invertase Pin-like site-specific DNA recombinase